MSDKKDIRKEIDYRFYHLLMRLDKGQEAAGVEVEGKISAEKSEQHNARRKLLKIEERAQRDKELHQRSAENYMKNISRLLNEEVFRRIEAEMEKVDHIAQKHLNLDPALAEILDAMSVKAASMSKLEPLVGELDWLMGEILHLVNNSKHRKRDRLGKAPRVDSIRMALSFLGIENLKLLVPSMIFKNSLPKHMETYPGFKIKILDHAYATALSAKQIATLSNVNENQAYTLGMLNEIGKIAITKMYFRHFEEVKHDALIEAHEAQKTDEHSAIQQTDPATEYWFKAMWKYSNPLAAKIIENMQLKRLFIAPAMNEIVQKKDIAKMDPLARVILQGDAYAKFIMLRGYKLMKAEQAKLYLSKFRMPKGSLALLKETDLKTLPLEDDPS